MARVPAGSQYISVIDGRLKTSYYWVVEYTKPCLNCSLSPEPEPLNPSRSSKVVRKSKNLSSDCWHSRHFVIKILFVYLYVQAPPTGGSRGFGRALEQMNFIKHCILIFSQSKPQQSPYLLPQWGWWGLTLIGA